MQAVSLRLFKFICCSFANYVLAVSNRLLVKTSITHIKMLKVIGSTSRDYKWGKYLDL